MGDEFGDVESARLTHWWLKLSERQQHEAFRLGAQTPMPMWMVRSLREAGFFKLVEMLGEPEELPPLYLMPASVAILVARRRRGDDTP